MSKWVFTPLDLVAPWGVGLGSAGLCLWAVLAGQPLGGQPLAAKVITGVVGLLFLLGIPCWYWVRGAKRSPTYVTANGLAVVVGKVHQPGRLQVGQWVENVIGAWGRRSFTGADGRSHQLQRPDVLKGVEGSTAWFVDKEKLSVWGRWVRGYAQGRDVVIGMKTLDKSWDHDHTESLLKHELSHLVLDRNGEPWNEQHHHQIFTTIGV